MHLVIVESPTKARTLSRFLGKDYQILASMGHLRDLPKNRLAVDVARDFAPEYVLVAEKKKIIDQLREASQKASQIILATDPDREGEAIAYHVAVVCSNFKFKISNLKFSRITFHEITKEAVQEALKNPGKVDMRLVDAQQARRILDRLVGYKLSPLLWSKIRRGLSAGRVQSVALRLIVEREREIENFQQEKYWTINAKLQKDNEVTFFNLEKIGDQKVEQFKKIPLFAGPYTYKTSIIDSQTKVKQILEALKDDQYKVVDVQSKEVTRSPGPPFITSTLQQWANRTFGFSSKKTMQVAQRLYEQGLITYHRTDSFNLAEKAIAQIRDYIGQNYGDKYLPEESRRFKTKSKLAQEAHEAIRPTEIKLKAKSSKLKALKRDEARLYEAIWKRAVATQMMPARFLQTKVLVKTDKNYLFSTQGQVLLFDGFLTLYPSVLKEKTIPKYEVGEILKLLELLPEENSTTPPPRYTEGTLVKTLESKGIGRPSTYAPLVSVIQTRQYVEKEQGKFLPTPVGKSVNDFLVANFANIIEIPFTANMEDDLDRVAQGKTAWVPVMKEFYTPFEEQLNKVFQEAKRVKIETEKTGKACPKCKEGEVVIRVGKYGKFLSCSRFPKCDYKESYLEKVKDFKCPTCGSEVVIRRTKKGKRFYGCSSWPKCNWASWRKPQ